MYAGLSSSNLLYWPTQNSADLWPALNLLDELSNHLHQLDATELLQLLTHLEQEITDETLYTITHGKDDTEHLLSSPSNATDLEQAIEELQSCTLLSPNVEQDYTSLWLSSQKGEMNGEVNFA